MLAAVLLALGAIFAITPLATPALALGAGIAIALSAGNPWRGLTTRVSGQLLHAAVVGLGFGIPLDALLRAGASGVAITAATIVTVFIAGLVLARWLAVERELAVLITAGTGICGGSAIAALGPAIGAESEAMGVSLATVFVLNAVALYVFPVVGHVIGLSQHQFGVWAALAIHDTSSVVGAAASYGPAALRDATILKLARALWILPLAVGLPPLLRRPSSEQAPVAPRRRVAIPWFIGLFVVAAVARSLATDPALRWFDEASALARTALVLTLFLIGASLTRTQLRTVGARPLVYGFVLWLGVAAASLAAVRWSVHG